MQIIDFEDIETTEFTVRFYTWICPSCNKLNTPDEYDVDELTNVVITCQHCAKDFKNLTYANTENKCEECINNCDDCKHE